MKINKYQAILVINITLFTLAYVFSVQAQMAPPDRLRKIIEERQAFRQTLLQNVNAGKTFFFSLFSLQEDSLKSMRQKISSREKLPADVKSQLLSLFDARISEVEGQTKKLGEITSAEALSLFIKELKISRETFQAGVRSILSSYLSSKGLAVINELKNKNKILEKKLSEFKRHGINISQVEKRLKSASNLIKHAEDLLQEKSSTGLQSILQGFSISRNETRPKAVAVFKNMANALRQAVEESKGALVSINEEAQKQNPITSLLYSPGDYRESITIDGRERTYFLHILQGFQQEKGYPLVIALHGGEGTGEKFASQTKFSTKADKEGFIVVYPDGIDNGWADGRGKTEAEKQGVNDVKFIRELVSHLRSKLPINNEKIYATGVSNGGMMTYRLGCDAADIFAAIGPDIANLPEPMKDKCKPANPIPLVAINGLADPLIPYEGGECCGREGSLLGGQGGVVLSTIETLKIFAQANKCATAYTAQTLPIIVDDGTSVEKRTYNNCPAGKEVISYVVSGMGHVWPPNPAEAPRISGPTSNNINATDVMWEFFKGHAKVGAIVTQFPESSCSPQKAEPYIQKMKTKAQELGLSAIQFQQPIFLGCDQRNMKNGQRQDILPNDLTGYDGVVFYNINGVGSNNIVNLPKTPSSFMVGVLQSGGGSNINLDFQENTPLGLYIELAGGGSNVKVSKAPPGTKYEYVLKGGGSNVSINGKEIKKGKGEVAYGSSSESENNAYVGHVQMTAYYLLPKY